MRYAIRQARIDDGEAMLSLVPRLAAFDVPASRVPEHLWKDDAKLLRAWLDGEAGDSLVQVAETEEGAIIGMTLVRLKPELLSHEPSAHLEVIVVAAGAEGNGVGRALLGAAEDAARRHGARTMTLHVFACNTRARLLYEKSGYDGELMRYIKPLE